MLASMLVLLALGTAAARDSVAAAPGEVRAARSNAPIVIDGALDEPVWTTAEVVDGFTQREPKEGQPATQRTVVRVAFDNAAVYIGATLYDTAPDSVRALLGRRDNFVNADRFTVFLDCYHDGRSGFYFGVNAAGTLYDGTLYNDEWDDNTWDGVWTAAARRTREGWAVEMRIPLSQLRFRAGADAIWGINFKREIARSNEKDYLVYTPSNGSGFVSRFVPLAGLDDVRPPARIEVRPYVTAKAELSSQPMGNPFNDGSRFSPGAGADFKIGLGGNLTLDGTVNPDFGQVEVDPAVVNLSDVESYFDERRPFFVEGANTFNFGRGGANSFWGFNWGGANQLFYSRRIGRAPQGSSVNTTFTDRPTGTHILGAGKLTGKVGSWNLGAVSALTRREHADLSDGTTRRQSEIEPSTYYGVARAQKEIAGGRKGVGILGTYTRRFFSNSGGPGLRDELNASALTGGIDGWVFLDKNRNWVVTGWVTGTRVDGSARRITALQQSSAHYFQRPDASHVHVDSAATSLDGWAARFTINRQKGNWFLNSALGFISPGYEINDLGFNFRTDWINGHVTGGYKWTQPNAWRRAARLDFATFRSYDFGGNNNTTGYLHQGNVQWSNYRQTRWAIAYNPATLNSRRSRGGPLTLNPRGVQLNFGGDSDDRRGFVFGWENYLNRYALGSDRSWGASGYVEWKPSVRISLRLSPALDRNVDGAQYIGTFADPTASATFGNRYVFANLRQTTLSSSVRLNWIFSPTVSLELYAQPLISSGAYRNYKELALARSYDFHQYGTGASTYDPATHTADPYGPAGPASPIALGNPDFTFASLRGNAVLRWEYSPGSTLFVVWTQNRQDTEEIGDFRTGHSLRRLFSANADNIFLVKLSYWWNP